jgi:hypothetical protein
VESCVGTILDVHEAVSEAVENDELLSQFRDLEKAIEDLDMNLVSEGDVLMVERATNALLWEFRRIFEAGELGPVYAQAMH